MSNMSYCRFENTAKDLADCIEHIGDNLSEPEDAARERILTMAIEIVEQSGLTVSGERK